VLLEIIRELLSASAISGLINSRQPISRPRAERFMKIYMPQGAKQALGLAGMNAGRSIMK
jgi:hypothetical protein